MVVISSDGTFDSTEQNCTATDEKCFSWIQHLDEQN